MRSHKVLAMLLLAAALMVPLSLAYASDESRECLGCHSKKGLALKFEDGSSVEAFVEEKSFRASAHGFLECPDCHGGFSASDHPKAAYRSKKLFRLRLSRTCRGCHKDEEICKKAMHESLLGREKKGDAPVCTDCHAAHTMAPVAGGRMFASEERHCMGCHSRDMSLKFRSGEAIQLRVDADKLRHSAHSNLSCSDCHFGFSSEEHPKRNFRTGRDYAIASADVCRRCHFDKYTKTLESIHYSVLSQGNLEAPTCTDCHGAHGIERVAADRTRSAQKCQKCHQGIYDIYAKSVHGAALLNEQNIDVPTCTHCHKAHEIGNPLEIEYHEKIPDMCSNCHADESIVGKYGLSTDVVKTYLSDFHGVTLGFYRSQKDKAMAPSKPIAVCTDCHGTHNIMSTVGPGAADVKGTLLKRCQKCHAGATEHFPDAWLSHYVPSLKKSPAIFIVNTIYKILLPLMVFGLLLQVMLHIWRYIANR